MSIFWRNGLFAATFLSVFHMAWGNQANYQDLQLIREAVTQDLNKRLEQSNFESYEINIQRLDNRLRLTACQQEISAKSTKPDQIVGRQSYEIRCNQPKPWKIYINVSVDAELAVPVLKHPLAAGSLITAADIESASVHLGNNSQPFIKQDTQLIGMKARRHLDSGVPILVSQLIAPTLVERGQQVSMEYQSGGLTVRMMGKANQSGAAGDLIKVVNLSSGKTVEGRITADGGVFVTQL